MWLKRSALATTVLLLFATGACSSGDETDGSDTLTIAVGNLGDESWIPQLSGSDNEGKSYRDLVYDYLLYVKTDDLSLTPGIATKWGVSKDGLLWHFDLREDVEFSDGNGPLTADDVAFSIELMGDPDSKTNVAPTVQDRVKEVRAVSDYRVEVEMKKPWAKFPYALSSSFAHAIVSKKYVEKVGVKEANREPVGSGPYTLKSQVPGDRMTFEVRDGEHWRLTPAFKKLVVRAVPDSNTRYSLLQNGEVDIAPLSLSDAPKAKDDADLRVETVPDANLYGFMMGGNIEGDAKYDPSVPWTKPEVREALNLAIDRDAIADSMFGDFGRSTAIPYIRFPGSEDLEPYRYDPERAKTLLADAGYPDGFDMELWNVDYQNNPGQVSQSTQAVAKYWGDIGIDVKIAQRDLTAFVPHIRDHTTKGFVSAEQLGSYVDLEFIGQEFYKSGGTHPEFYSDELDALWDKLQGTVAEADRDAVFAEISKVLYDEFAVVPLVTADLPVGLNDRKIAEWKPMRGLWLSYWEYATAKGSDTPPPTNPVF